MDRLLKIFQIMFYIASVFGVLWTANNVRISFQNLQLNKDKMAYDAEKSKKEFAIISVLQTVDNLDTGLSCVSLIADMSESEIVAIFDYNRLNISAAHIAKLKGCMAGQKEKDMIDNKNNLTNIGSYYIRSKVVSTLNKLEIMVIASCNGIFDIKILDMLLSNIQHPFFKAAIAKIRGLNNDIGYGYLDAYITNKENPCNKPTK